ncbi:MAG: Rrf2 family transcriptional regulator [Acidobacteriia bacterium]|nr:Rrf2 family transcriptional regulator [Terriglobia bacterium]
MFSQTTEYALRAVVWLAAHGSEPQTTLQIAAATHVPAGYLSKVLQALGRANLVSSQRGLYGGFTLTRGPDTISVLAVVNAVDPIQRIETCPLGLKSHGKELCALHRRLDNAIAHIQKAFAESTIADLLAEPSTSHPLCEAEGSRGT